MRFFRHIAATATLALATIPSVSAYPPLARSALPEQANALEERQQPCAGTLCGFYKQLCCQTDQYCYTDSNNQAACGEGAAPAGAGWQVFTTTYTVANLETVTTVYSVAAPVASPNGVVTVTVEVPASEATAVCNYQLGQTSCGSICCAQGQFCASAGQCVNNGATTAIGGGAGGATITAAIRPTSITTYTVVTTGGVTTTVPFLAPASATNSITAVSTGSSLSGGAIAGIVIGVLLGIIILIIIIICCCARGLLDLFRPKRKTEVTEIYESHHHASGSAAGRPPKRRFPFFGGGGGGKTEKKEGKGWLGVAGILAAVALVLGLKRRRDRREEEKESTAYTYSDYTYDYSTSASSASSDRRSRNTRSDIRSSRSRR